MVEVVVLLVHHCCIASSGRELGAAAEGTEGEGEGGGEGEGEAGDDGAGGHCSGLEGAIERVNRDRRRRK